MEGLGRMLAKKLCSNSLASWSKDNTKAGCSQLNHVHAGPLKVVGNAQNAATRLVVVNSHQGVRSAVEGHLSSECSNMFH